MCFQWEYNSRSEKYVNIAVSSIGLFMNAVANNKYDFVCETAILWKLFACVTQWQSHKIGQ